MPVVDVAYVLSRGRFPADHGYALYGALSRLIPALHPLPEGEGAIPSSGACGDVGVHPIRGRVLGQRQMELIPQSRLVLRLPSERILEILPLAGQTLFLERHHLVVGIPSVQVLLPAPTLTSRLVLLKGKVEPEPFLASVQHHLEERGIRGEARLVSRIRPFSQEGRGGLDPSRSPYVRRTLRIKDRNVVGFAVEIRGLSEESSLCLQERGLGGRRRMGCGIFSPVRERRG